MTNGQACASYKGDEKNYRIETPFKHKIKELDMFGLRFSFLFFSKFFLLFSERKKSIFFYHTFIRIVASFHTLMGFTFNETMSFGGHGIYEWMGARGYRRLYTKQIIKKTLKPPKNPQGIKSDKIIVTLFQFQSNIWIAVGRRHSIYSMSLLHYILLGLISKHMQSEVSVCSNFYDQNINIMVFI